MHQLIQSVQRHFNITFPDEDWLCLVLRHFVERSSYPQVQKTTGAAEAAAAQGQFLQDLSQTSVR